MNECVCQVPHTGFFRQVGTGVVTLLTVLYIVHLVKSYAAPSTMEQAK